MTKNPILMAAVLGALPDLPPSATARKPGSGQVSQIVGSRGQQLVLETTERPHEHTETAFEEDRRESAGFRPRTPPVTLTEIAAPYLEAKAQAEHDAELKPDENGVVQYVTAQDEMYMACQWLCSLSEEDCAQVLPILRQIKEAYVESTSTEVT